MAGLPTIKVTLDDGTGAFPYDVTPYVNLSSGVDITSGRASEFDDIDPAQCKLQFDNLDGRFTLGNATYGIAVDQRIRVTETVGATTSVRFTGYVQDWPTSWPSPTASYAVASITAIDRMARLNRRKLRSMFEEQILSRDPMTFYTLGEPSGSTSAGDTSNNAQPVLTINDTGFAGGPMTFGEGTGPSDGLTAAVFAGAQNLAGGQFNVSGGYTLMAFLLHAPGVPLPELAVGIYGSGGSQGIGFGGTTGRPFFTSSPGSITSGPTNIADGQTHHLAVTVSTTTATLYVDGTSVASMGIPAGVLNDTKRLVVGGEFMPNTSVVPFSGTASHVALYPSLLSAADISAAASMGLRGAVGERSDQRVARLGSYANIAPGAMDLDTGAALVAQQSTSGQSVIDAMRDVATAEGGSLFIDAMGDLVFQNRTHRVSTAMGTPGLGVTTAEVDHDDLNITVDKQYLVNTVSGSRPDGATQAVTNPASIAKYDEYPNDLGTVLVLTDAEVLDAITWRVTNYGEVSPRLSSVTLDLTTLPSATQQAAMNLRQGDRITISGLPAQSPVSTADVLVEGLSESVRSGSWRLTFNTVPADTYRVWVLGDATYGVLGTTTRLYY